MANILIYLLILLSGFPAAFFISKLCKDEIKNWRGRLLLISIVSLLISVLSYIKFELRLPIIISLIFVVVMNLTIIWISYK